MRPRGSVHLFETAVPLRGIDQEAAAPHAKTGRYIVLDSIAHSYALFPHGRWASPGAFLHFAPDVQEGVRQAVDRSLTLRLSRCCEAAKTAIMS